MTLNMYPNGTYSRMVSTISEFGWTLEGDLLWLAPAVAATDSGLTYGKVSALRIRLEGDSLIASASRNSVVLRRVTTAVPDAPLLGRWTGNSDLNETITQDFTVDGRLIVTATVSQEAGRYSISRDEIEFYQQIPEPGTRRIRFEMKDGKMRLYIARQLPPIILEKIPEVPAL
jgi:hypothetical protein